MKKIIFVCTGNTCRSPMAAAFANSLLKNEYEAESFGLSAAVGERASANAVAVMREVGIDISNHKARQLAISDIEKADVIVTLGRSHYDLLSQINGISHKLRILGNGIRDPFMQSIDVYRACRDEIRKSVADMFLDVKISEMKESDIPQIADIETETFSTPWSKDGLASELTKKGSHFFAARFGNVVLGYTGFFLCADEAYMANIAVKKEYRGLEIGKRLMNCIVRQAEELGARFITLEVRSSNNIAKKMYEGMGFEKVGERRKFYEKPQENADLYTLYFDKER